MVLGGQSGANIVIDPSGLHVVKRAPDTEAGRERLKDQFAFLFRYGKATNQLVQVHALEEGSAAYRMERLNELPVEIIDPFQLARTMEQILERTLWRRPAAAHAAFFDWNEHLEYVRDRANVLGREQRDQMLSWAVEISELSESECLRHGVIHGDPTFANVMLRGDKLVFIDPIPTEQGKTPPLMALDRGKIMQSLAGYEGTRFNWPFHLNHQDLWAHARHTLRFESAHEENAAHYFCVLHFLRLIPYAPEAMTVDFVRVAEELLVARRLRRGWGSA